MDSPTAGGTALQQESATLQHELSKVMRTFGRQCQGKRKVFVTWVRQTERHLLQVGEGLVPLALSAQLYLHETQALRPSQKSRLDRQLQEAVDAHQGIEAQSRRLVHGKKLPHCKIVNPYDRTIAPISKGKSNCPTQFGKKPGIIAEMATGFIFGFHLPSGNPADASYVPPLLEKVDHALDRRPAPRPQRRPTIRSLAGDLGLNKPEVRAALHRRGTLTVGIPQTSAPLPQKPTPEQIQQAQQIPDLEGSPSVTQIKMAYACGYSRPFVESLITHLGCRGATRIKYKGHRGAVLQIAMAILAANAATLVRIQNNQLTQRAQKFRRWFRLKSPNFNKNNIQND
jgi:hypothetical protein